MFSFTLSQNLPKFETNWWANVQKQWAPELLKDNRSFWPVESDPSNGRPWAALTPNYASQKLKKYPGQPILRATGKMLDSVKLQPWNSGIQAVSELYGPFHQFGTKKMVARPWLGVPNSSLKKLTKLAWDNIIK
jgi:phage gpG-like protein